MALTIEEFLMGIGSTQASKSSKFDPRTVWEGIANKQTYDDLGFNSEEDLKDFLVDNPYENIR